MDKCLPSQKPPMGLDPKKIPQFVAFGFDDNERSGFTEELGVEGMKWVVDAFGSRKNPDGTACSCAFYQSSSHINWPAVIDNEAPEAPGFVKKSWKYAMDAGFEIGNHTHTHPFGRKLGVGDWVLEMQKCNDVLSQPYVEGDDGNDTGIGIPVSDIRSFRTPYLTYNDNTFKAMREMGCFLYDCSLGEGHQPDQDGTNFFFPYTLDEGSPGNAYMHANFGDPELEKIGSYPGLWEVPVYCIIAPPDECCKKYGIPKGLRKRLHAVGFSGGFFNEIDGKITGLDYNCLAQLQMTADEYLATLKYTLDLRLQGNRAPFAFGTHSGIYAKKYRSDPKILISEEERRRAVEEFLDYALTKPEVFVVAPVKVVEWMRDPKEL